MRKLAKRRSTSEIGFVIDCYNEYYLMRFNDGYELVDPNEIIILEQESIEIKTLKHQMSELIDLLADHLNFRIDDKEFITYISEETTIEIEEYLKIMNL